MADVKGIGTVEYGKLIYGGLEVPRDYAPRPATIPDYAMVVQADHPLYYLRMDELAGGLLVDFSESQNHAYYLGTLDTNKAPLATGGNSCLFRSGGYAFSDAPPPLRGGQSARAFTIEFWTKPKGAPGNRLLVGRNDVGVHMTNTGFEFRVTNTAGVVHTAAYTVDTWDQNYHIVAQFNSEHVYFYVNGKPSSQAQFTGELPVATSPLYVGGDGTAGPEVYLDEVAVFRGLLPGHRIIAHYNAGVSKSLYRDLVVSDGAIYFSFDESNADVALRYQERGLEDFLKGTLTNLEVVNGELVLINPALSGTRVSPPIDLGELGIIDSSRVDWETTTDGVILEASLNLGSTWVALTNHNPVPGLGSGVDATNKLIMFRTTIPANTTQRVNRFGFSVFRSRTTKSLNSNLAAATSGVVNITEGPYDFMNERVHVGAVLNSGHMTINPTDTQFPVKTISFFFRRDQLTYSNSSFLIDVRPMTDGYILFNTSQNPAVTYGWSVSKVYVNGVAVQPDIAYFPLGEWVHVTVVFNTAVNGVIGIGARSTGTGAIVASFAHLSLFSYELSQDQVANHAEAGFSKNYEAVGDFRLSVVTDAAPRFHSHDWLVVGASV